MVRDAQSVEERRGFIIASLDRAVQSKYECGGSRSYEFSPRI